MQEYYRIDVIAHFKPARYSHTYYLLPEAKEAFEAMKREWESNEVDYFNQIRGPRSKAISEELDKLYALEEVSDADDERMGQLQTELDELEDDTAIEFMYRSELVATEVGYPHVILDEFTAYDE